MKKILLLGIISCLFSVFLMSHNTSAVDLSQNVDFVGTQEITQMNYITNGCRISGTRVYNQNADRSDCSISNMSMNVSGNYYKGDILVFDFWANELANNSSLHDTVRKAIKGDFYLSSYIDLMGVEINQFSANSSKISYIFYVKRDNFLAESISLQNNGQAIFIIASNSGNSWFDVDKMYHFHVRENAQAATASDIANALSNQTGTIMNQLYGLGNQLNYINDSIVNSNNKLDEIAGGISSLPESIADEQTEKEKEKVEESANEAEDAANATTSENEAATSSLLSVLTGFFGVIINASPTKCSFDSHLPFLDGSGEIDLCMISTPPIIQGIGSLIALGLFAPFALHMFKRFISITESFQR